MRYLILLLLPALALAQPPTHCIGGFCECFDSQENGYVCAQPLQAASVLPAPEISPDGVLGALTFLGFSAAVYGRRSRQRPKKQDPQP